MGYRPSGQMGTQPGNGLSGPPLVWVIVGAIVVMSVVSEISGHFIPWRLGSLKSIVGLAAAAVFVMVARKRQKR